MDRQHVKNISGFFHQLTPLIIDAMGGHTYQAGTIAGMGGRITEAHHATNRLIAKRAGLRHGQRVLDAGGVYIMNCGDTADLAGAKAEAATLLEVFEHVAMVADPPMLKGRRYGNIVFLASDEPLKLGPAFERSLRTAPLPAQLVAGEAVRRFATGAAPITG